MRRYIAMTCVFVFLSLCGFTTPARGADKWLSVRSKNFLLVGNASEAQIRRVGRNLEEFRAGLAVLFPIIARQSSSPMNVVVFKDDASFRPFKPLYEGKPSNVAGYFQSGSDVDYIALTGDTETPRVIFHEFVHSLTRDASSPLPPWASEGLAELYSTFEFQSGDKQLVLGKVISDHVLFLKDKTLLPFRALASVDHGSPYYNEGTKQGVFYAESWAAVHYLLLANNSQRKPQFEKYLSLLAGGRSIDDSFREAFQMSYDEFDRELRQYVQARVAYPALQFKLQSKVDFDRDMQAAPVSDAEAQFYLGDLLMHMNRLDTAEAQLQKAISLDSKFAAAYASMGMLKMRQGHRDEALKFLETGVENDSRNHMAHYYFAFMLQENAQQAGGDRRASLERARTHIKKSIELTPNFFEGYNLLGYVSLMLQDQLEETETILKNAVNLAPGRQHLRLRLAEVMAMNGETQAARVVVYGLKNSADEEIRMQAEGLISSFDARLENERALREYEERRKALAAEEAARPAGATPQPVTAQPSPTSDEPPKIARNESANRFDNFVYETANPQPKGPSGLQMEGLLVSIDCSRGMTIRVRAGNVIVELHSNTPEKVEFVSSVATVKDSIACGIQKGEPAVVITYKRNTSDPRFLGEPLHVDFVEKK